MARETWVYSQGRVIPKTQKMVLDASTLYTLAFIRYGLRVSRAIQEWYPLIQLGFAATEKGAFGSPSTMVGRLTTLMASLR